MQKHTRETKKQRNNTRETKHRGITPQEKRNRKANTREKTTNFTGKGKHEKDDTFHWRKK